MLYADAARVTLERIRLHVQQRLSRELLNDPTVTALINQQTGDAIVHAIAEYAGQKQVGQVECVYPTTWWDAFKDRWFPGWLKRRYPPAFTRTVLNAQVIYPNLRLPDHTHTITLFENHYPLERRKRKPHDA